MSNSKQKTSKLPQLLISFLGIYASYLSGGFLLEKIFRTKYGPDQKPFDNTITILILQSVFSYLLGIFLIYLSPHKSKGMTLRSQLKVGGYTFVSMFSGFQGNINLSFLTNNLVQNCKGLAIIIIAAFYGKISYKRSEQLVVLLTTGGMFIFYLGQDSNSSKQTTAIGWITCAVSLLSSGLLGASQKIATDEEKSTSYDLLTYTNFWCGLFSIIYWFATGGTYDSIAFYTKYPAAFKDLLVLVATGVSGQFFTYYTIENFSPLFLNIISTSRKFITIFISIIAFGHKVATVQYLGIFILYGGIIYEIYIKITSEQQKGKLSFVKNE